MRTDYLTAIADMLDDPTMIPRGRFTMESWWSLDGECRTVGCAIGWARHHDIIHTVGHATCFELNIHIMDFNILFLPIFYRGPRGGRKTITKRSVSKRIRAFVSNDPNWSNVK